MNSIQVDLLSKYYRKVHHEAEVAAVINVLMLGGWQPGEPEELPPKVEFHRSTCTLEGLAAHMTALSAEGWLEIQYEQQDTYTEVVVEAWRPIERTFLITAIKS